MKGGQEGKKGKSQRPCRLWDPPINFELIKSNEVTRVSFNQERWAMERLLMLAPIIPAESKRRGGHVRGETQQPRSPVLKNYPVSDPGARTTK